MKQLAPACVKLSLHPPIDTQITWRTSHWDATSGLKQKQWHQQLDWMPQNVCSADQLCAGAKAGTEAAVHVMKELFEANESEGLLLLDAANAFNALKRLAAL